MLKAGGRAGVVIKNTFLSNGDNASVSLRRLLLESCNLLTVLDCPSGTFQGAGVKTVVLFFEEGAPTRKIWFYQLDPGRSLGKLLEFVLAHYVGEGVRELDPDKLTPLLRLRYHDSISDAVAELGEPLPLSTRHVRPRARR